MQSGLLLSKFFNFTFFIYIFFPLIYRFRFLSSEIIRTKAKMKKNMPMTHIQSKLAGKGVADKPITSK